MRGAVTVGSAVAVAGSRGVGLGATVGVAGIGVAEEVAGTTVGAIVRVG